LRKLVNFVAFQVGWLACVLGAANGRPWLGPIVALILAGGQWALWWRSMSLLKMFAFAAVVGYAADSLVVAGLMSFPPEAALGAPSSLWMAALWVNFATTLDESLAWLQGRPAWAALLGLGGGPLAYWGGEKLGAIRLEGWPALAAVGVEWAVATPLLLGTLRWAQRGDAR
jgi:hypothetical protein